MTQVAASGDLRGLALSYADGVPPVDMGQGIDRVTVPTDSDSLVERDLAAILHKLVPGKSVLQLGTGALALGHNLPAFDWNDLSVVLANRIDTSPAPERLRRLMTSREVRKVIVRVEADSGGYPLTFQEPAFTFPFAGMLNTSTERGVEMLTALVASPDIAVLNLAARGGLTEFASPIVRGISERNPLARLTIVSCENTRPPNWDIFVASCREFPHVEVVESSVDSICVLPGPDLGISGCDVYTEDYRLWVVQRDHNGILEEVLSKSIESGHVESVDDIRPYRLAKSFLVNSLQLGLALRAAADGEQFLHRVLYQSSVSSHRRGESEELRVGLESYGDDLFEELVAALKLALEALFPRLNSSKFAGERAFAHQPMKRLSSFPDQTSRLLKILHPTRQLEYDIAVADRLRQPRDLLRQAGFPAPALEVALDMAGTLWRTEAWQDLHGDSPSPDRSRHDRGGS